MVVIDKTRLTTLYDKGIDRTGFKSNMLEKINELRSLLGLPLRTEALPERHYDKQVVDELAKIDFSSLDNTFMPGAHSLKQAAVLNFAGAGFTAAADVADNSGAEVNLGGAGAEPPSYSE